LICSRLIPDEYLYVFIRKTNPPIRNVIR
jgi:hypothetical protein